MIATIIEATSELKLLARRRNLGRIIDDLFGMELVTIWLGVRLLLLLLLVGLVAEVGATTKSRLFDDIVVVFVVADIVVLLLVVTNIVVVVAEWYATVCT